MTVYLTSHIQPLSRILTAPWGALNLFACRRVCVLVGGIHVFSPACLIKLMCQSMSNISVSLNRTIALWLSFNQIFIKFDPRNKQRKENKSEDNFNFIKGLKLNKTVIMFTSQGLPLYLMLFWVQEPSLETLFLLVCVCLGVWLHVFYCARLVKLICQSVSKTTVYLNNPLEEL